MCSLLLASAVASNAFAQVFLVTVTDSKVGDPLSFAIISLEDSAGARLSPVLADQSGEAVLLGRGGGAYTVRIDRVGMLTWRGPPIRVEASDTLRLAYDVAVAPRQLVSVAIIEDKVCFASATDNVAIATRWDETRKALLSAERGSGKEVPITRVARFERLLDRFGRVESERWDTSIVRSARPFATLPPEALASVGYRVASIDGDVFYAPDAGVLLSDAFAREHCFNVASRAGAPELTGLTFQPARPRDIVDISGVFWIDRATAELREIEYRYENANEFASTARAGGVVRFERSTRGGWIIASWMVRTPRVAVVRTPTGGGNAVERTDLIGVREEGAVVRLISTVQTAAGESGVLRGLLLDGAAGGVAIADARVRVVGMAMAGRTDSLGRFSAAPLVPGPHTLRIDHERLMLYRVPPQREVTIRAGDTTRVTVMTPNRDIAYAALCGDKEPPSGARHLGGVVARVMTWEGDGGVPFAAFFGAWRSGSVRRGADLELIAGGQQSSNADDAGFGLLCALPTGVPIRVTVSAAGFRPTVSTLRIAAGRVAEHVFRLQRCRDSDPVSRCPER